MTEPPEIKDDLGVTLRVHAHVAGEPVPGFVVVTDNASRTVGRCVVVLPTLAQALRAAGYTVKPPMKVIK